MTIIESLRAEAANLKAAMVATLSDITKELYDVIDEWGGVHPTFGTEDRRDAFIEHLLSEFLDGTAQNIESGRLMFLRKADGDLGVYFEVARIEPSMTLDI